jgi:Na+/H+ antiporter NhaD/arsenite permease-like protein
MIGAALALILVRPNPDDILHDVHWSVLLFFGALFVVVGGIEKAGILDLVATRISSLATGNLMVTCIVIIWVSAILSAIVDNIPFTMAMIPVIQYLETQGINVTPLWWALAMGVGFGGNGTPIGSTANVVTVAISEKTDHPITFKIWIKSGSQVMFATCVMATIIMIVLFRYFE